MGKPIHKSTQAIHSVTAIRKSVNPVSMPIHLSTTYERNTDGTYDEGLIYSRNDNPNRNLLEKSLALLEQGEVAMAFSSGMAAISAVFQSLQPNDHVLLPDDVYYKLRVVMSEHFIPWGIRVDYVDMTNLEEVQKSITPQTSLIWLESPSNPLLKITDIRAIADISQSQDITICVDNTWSTPVLLNPLTLGADVVVHSTTKYIGGHSDVMGGAVICREQGQLSDKILGIQKGLGAVPSPFDCWLLSRGIQTLDLRVRAQSKSAYEIARALQDHGRVEDVFYPGLASDPGHSIAKSQMQQGYGAMLSFTVLGGESAARYVCNNLQLFTQATSLGGVESLVEHRKSVEGEYSTSPENLIRVSVGLEHSADLIADLHSVLDAYE